MERESRTVSKRGGVNGRGGTSVRAGSPRGKRGPQAAPRRRPGAADARARSGSRPGPDRVREIVALVLFGVAVFLIFCLVATDKAGVVGRAIHAALVFAFGRLAFLAPAACIAIGVTTVAEFKIRRSYRSLAVIVFLVGLFLLMAGGVPPFGSHGADLFVRAGFEGRAGGLGEAFYGVVHGLMGIVGVGIIGWILVLAGFSLASGVTARLLGRRTRDAAHAVRTSAERSTLLTRRRDEAVAAAGSDPFGEADTLRTRAARTAGSAWPVPLDGRHPNATVPQIGPIDLVSHAAGTPPVTVSTSDPGVFGGAFDDWASGRAVYRSPLAPTDAGGQLDDGRRPVLDGAQAFADLFETTQGSGAASGMGAAAVAGTSVGTAPHVAGGIPAEEAGGGDGAGSELDGLDGPDGERQESLPGLARQPRQIELAVSEPAYVLPQPDMLRKSTPSTAANGSAERDTSAVLLQALSQFGVQARVIGMVVGPRVTRYELHLAPGTKVGKVSALKDDLAYALATTEIRILAPIPGKSAVGVEVPNQRPDFVTLGDIYREFPKSAGPLMVWLGKDISGKAVYADLTRLPHLLIAGTTGSGKSGCVNCLVSSVLLRSTPELVRMIMIDPKKVELSHYDRIPHLLVPVVTNMKEAAGVLHNVVKEMEDRYELMELDHARSLPEMNKTRARRGERPVPYILIVIDELADLMMSSPQEVEDYVIRLAQKSRAVGIHLVVATQRPSADVITGMIKANIPSRIAFAVSSQTDSRVILDVNGAETLLGMGDMLFKPLGSSHLQRVQGAYITEEEIAVLVNHWRHQAEPEFREELLRRPVEAKKGDRSEDEFDPDSDDLLADAAQLVIETGSASVSMLQRRLRVGYTRAGRLIDMLERRGIVGKWEGSKPRQILIEPDDFEQVLSALKAEERIGDGEDFD